MKNQILLHKLGGYYLIPHELLHVLAYRIIGKPCHYGWGNHYVKPLEKMTLPQRLFTSLFPFLSCFGVGLCFILAWMTLSFFANLQPDHPHDLTWHMVLVLFGSGLAFYSTTAEGDIMNSYYLLFAKDKPQDYRPKQHGDSDNDSP